MPNYSESVKKQIFNGKKTLKEQIKSNEGSAILKGGRLANFENVTIKTR